VSFPAMRSAGVSTSVVEIRTSRQFNRIEALQLNGREVQAIEDALTRDKSGGMDRVLRLIRSRGQEPVRPTTKQVNWSRGVGSYEGDSNDDSGSDSGGSTSAASVSNKTSVETTTSESDESSVTVEADSTADATTEATESQSSISVSADRRSYY
jgi:hypothetical protein